MDLVPSYLDALYLYYFLKELIFYKSMKKIIFCEYMLRLFQSIFSMCIFLTNKRMFLNLISLPFYKILHYIISCRKFAIKDNSQKFYIDFFFKDFVKNLYMKYITFVLKTSCLTDFLVFLKLNLHIETNRYKTSQSG